MLTPTRSILGWLHRWLGVTSAFFIILIAGSGAMLAFVGELFLLQYGDVLKATPPAANAQMANIPSLIASASQGYKDDFQTVGVLMPHSRIEEIETAMVFVMPSGSHADEGIRMLSVDPWTTEYKGDFALSRAFAHELLDFHHALLLGDAGVVFVCIISILLMVFVATGVYLWWPKQNKVWRKATRLTLRGSIKQVCFSVHGWFGVWSALFILYFCLTGLALAKPGWFSPLLSPMVYAPPASANFDKLCDGHVSAGDAQLEGEHRFPDKKLATFFMPNRKDGPYMLTYKSNDDNNLRDGDGRIYVHASCKGLVHIVNAESLKTSTKITDMMLSLHGGYTFGKLIGKTLVILTGLSLLILAGTGGIVFLGRIQQNNKKLLK